MKTKAFIGATLTLTIILFSSCAIEKKYMGAKTSCLIESNETSTDASVTRVPLPLIGIITDQPNETSSRTGWNPFSPSDFIITPGK
jgi:hypothetical protein